MNLEDYVFKAFQQYNIIGLGEGGHGLENSHELFRKMFDSKKIQETIDIVIVEFANVAYQGVLDKYIFGEEVDINDLRKAWRESSQPGRQGELPIYFELLQKIRNINKRLPQDKKIRVLGGDPFINWKEIHTRDDWFKHLVVNNRDKLAANLAIESGLNQAKKVLVIYSEVHLTKIVDEKTRPNSFTITSLINKQYPNAMHVIGTIYANAFLSDEDLKKMPLYSIINLKEDELGSIPAQDFFQASLYKDGKEIFMFDGHKTKELFDALLYVGQFDSLRRCPIPEPDFDDEYWDELNRRRNIVGMPQIPKTK